MGGYWHRAMVVGILYGAGLTAAPVLATAQSYAWRPGPVAAGDTLEARFAPPAGFRRPPAGTGTLEAWLRGLPLKAPGTPVLLHTGRPKSRQDVHAAVIDIDTGWRDLQQCADAVMRLIAEWRYARGEARLVAFNDTSHGQPMSFARWAAGERPQLVGRALVWTRSAPPDGSYASFRRYLDTVFTWAGTHSLERELRPVSEEAVRAGDVFIKGGFPGHAVLVADVAENPQTGERRVLLVQSFMPAQDMHVLRNPGSVDGTPWYAVVSGRPLVTPEWVFEPGRLRRWPGDERPARRP